MKSKPSSRVRSVEPMKDMRREVLEGEDRPAGAVAQPVASRAS